MGPYLYVKPRIPNSQYSKNASIFHRPVIHSLPLFFNPPVPTLLSIPFPRTMNLPFSGMSIRIRRLTSRRSRSRRRAPTCAFISLLSPSSTGVTSRRSSTRVKESRVSRQRPVSPPSFTRLYTRVRETRDAGKIYTIATYTSRSASLTNTLLM